MPDSPAEYRRQAIQRIALAGNALALLAILLLAANAGTLFRTTVPAPGSASLNPQHARRMVLVVVDGLRADAVTRGVMPQLQALAGRGAIRTSRVQALLPSTVAGLRALVEGVVVAPAQFVNDFRSPRAARGGLLEAVHVAGGQIFAAGPRLWGDLYGEWIDEKMEVFGLARDDATVLRAAKAAVADTRWRVVIAHFSSPDVMAHMHGADSAEYRQSAAWCDTAIGQLADAADTDTLMVVTSDHGVTRAGGHAGAEPDVLATPLVVSDPGLLPSTPELAQPWLPQLLAGALSVTLPPAVGSPPLSRTVQLLVAGLAVAIGVAALLIVLGESCAVSLEPRLPFWLNLSVWLALALAWWNSAAAGAVGIVALSAVAVRKRSRFDAGLWQGAFVGGALGLLRIVDFWPGQPGAHPGVAIIAIVCVTTLLAGTLGAQWAARGTREATWLGIAFIFVAAIGQRILGESASLSTIDVRLAFRLIDTPLGLPGAVICAALQPFLPMLALIAGLAVAWRSRPVAPLDFGAVAAGMAAALGGELATATFLLHHPRHDVAAPSLGVLARETALITIVFLALALAARLSRKAQVLPMS